MSSAIDIRAAFRIYPSVGGPVAALQGLDLTVERGEVVVALGPSGSGKTTLLRVVAGFEPLSAGSAHVLGIDVTRLGPTGRASFRAGSLGFLDQHYTRSIPRGLSCRRVVALGLELRGEDPAESRREAGELLERVGLANRAEEHPQQLSGGEQQRVALCAAIAHRPELVLADEPAGELDDESARLVYTALADLARAGGATLLIVSHDSAAETIADRIVTISDGRAVAEHLPGGPQLLVTSRGWLRIPDAYLRDVGEPRRVTAQRSEGALVLRPADRPSATEAHPPGQARSSVEVDLDTPVAELRNVVKRYGTGQRERVVLERATISIASGRIVAVIGRSGSGKTTLLHLLAGLELPTEGDVLVRGRSLSALSRPERALVRRAHIALVSQEPGLVPYLSAAENIALGLSLRQDVGGSASVEKALGDVGLDGQLRKRVSVLSAGERQRVAIARALVSKAELVLVDEPTARLDRENARVVARLLTEAARGEGRAVVIATHDAELIAHADETVVVRGRGLSTRARPDSMTASS